MKNLIEDRKHKAEKVAWLLQIVPFISFIGLTGSLAHNMAKRSSDIDFFVITKNKRIWTCRFFTVVVLKLFRLYRSGNSISERAGKICPNRYVTDKYLLINPQNRYHAEDYSKMLPLYDRACVYQDFLKKNSWMNGFGYKHAVKACTYVQSAGILSGIRKLLEWILAGNLGNKFELFVKKIQLKSIMKDKRVNKPNTGLYVDDNELRFHPEPR